MYCEEAIPFYSVSSSSASFATCLPNFLADVDASSLSDKESSLSLDATSDPFCAFLREGGPLVSSALNDSLTWIGPSSASCLLNAVSGQLSPGRRTCIC
jgi:hypothetical protein